MKKLIYCLLLLSLSSHAEVATIAGVTCEIERDQYGKIVRSKKVLSDFRKSVPCPGTGRTMGRCEGYVIDHIKPLCGCGADAVENLQWQTVEDAKVKDRWERKLCAAKVVSPR